MRAVVYSRHGSPDVLEIKDVEKPVPKDNEVLIRVRAASVNPLDAGLIKGMPSIVRVLFGLPTPKDTHLGVDVAGQVAALGRNVTRFKPGDEVFGVGISDPQAAAVKVWIPQGAFAEYVCATESTLVVKPENVTFAQAASVPVAAFTALQGLRDKGHIRTGQKVLINGAAGGVGTFAVQIAKSFGAEVTGVCSTRNMEMVRSIGPDRDVDYTREDFTSSGEQYDVIFDLVANHSFSEHRRVLTPKGKYVGAGIMGLGGSMIRLLTSRITELVLSPFVSQKFPSFMAKLNQKDLTAIGALMAEGKLTPVIDRRYSLSEAAEAVSYLEEGHAQGKVMIDFVPARDLSTV